VDEAFEGSALQRVIAQIDVSFSHSLFEAWWGFTQTSARFLYPSSTSLEQHAPRP
jgi:hypothetical protein